MVQIGQINKLKVIKRVDFGVFLDGDEDGSILLPKRDVPENCELGAELDVFIYFDSEDRLIATTKTPLAMVGDFALLRVLSVERTGAFLDWGLPKDLLLPYAEQSRPLRRGDLVVVFLYLDNSDRIAASMRIDRHIDKSPSGYSEGQEVQLLVFGKTDLGFKAIIEGRHLGMIYENEVFQEVKYGQVLQGYIKKLRPDGKIDLALQKTGRKAADDIAPQILELLEKNGGYLQINDKTPAEEIYRLFGVSKKKYKIALGGLYKKRLLTVEEDGIRLVKAPAR